MSGMPSSSRLDELLNAAERESKSVRRSMMTGLRFGRTRKDLDEQLSARNQTAEELRKRGIVISAEEEMKEQLAELEKAGIKHLMLQWLDLDDLKGLEALAKVAL